MQVSIAFESWHLVFPLHGRNVSTTGILGTFLVQDKSSEQEAEDFLTLLNATEWVSIHVFDENEHASYKPIYVKAQWVRSAWSALGLEVAFSIQESDQFFNRLLPVTHLPVTHGSQAHDLN